MSQDMFAKARAIGKRIRPSPFMYDLAITTLTSGVSVVSMVVVTRLLAGALGPEVFGVYQLSRRFLTTAWPVASVCMSVAVVRYVAIAQDELERDRHLLGGIILAVVPSILFLVVGASLGDRLTTLIFHDTIYRPLLLATLWQIVAYSIYGVLYAFYRGQNRMLPANLWQAAALAVGPVVVAAAFGHTGRADLIVALCAVLMGCAGIPLAYQGLRALARSGYRPAVGQAMRQLARYGGPRVPGGFALAGLFAVGPFMAPYFGSLKEAGYLSAGQSILVALQGGLVAFGLVALPRVAQMVVAGRQQRVSKAIADIIALVTHLGLFITWQGLLWADEIVRVLLGVQYRDATPLMRIVLLSVVPYLAYVMLRSIVDAVEEKAINTINLFVALAVAALVGWLTASLGLGTTGLAIGSTLGFVVLGASTVWYLARSYQLQWQTLQLRHVLLINAGFLVLGIAVKVALEASLHGMLPLLAASASAVAGMFALYTLALRRLRVSWMGELTQRILARQGR